MEVPAKLKSRPKAKINSGLIILGYIFVSFVVLYECELLYFGLARLSNTFFQWKALTILMAIQPNSDVHLGVVPGKRERWGAVLCSYAVGKGSLGAAHVFSDRIT